MEFVTNFRLDNWVKQHARDCNLPNEKQFVYSFQSSSLIERQTVKCIFCGKEFTYTKIL